MRNAIRAELLKWRHNWFPPASAGAALAVPLLLYLVAQTRGGVPTAQMVMSSLMTFYLMLIGPLVVTLVGAQTIAGEYQWDTWKLLMTAPLPRWSVYMAKWLLGVLWIIDLSLVVVLAGFGVIHLLHAPGPVDYGLMLKVFLLGGTGLSTFLAVYQFITLVSRNFFVTSTVGIVGAFASLLNMQSKYMGVFPITGNLLLTQTLVGRQLQTGEFLGTPAVWVGVLAIIAVVGLVCSLVYVQAADYR